MNVMLSEHMIPYRLIDHLVGVDDFLGVFGAVLEQLTGVEC